MFPQETVVRDAAREISARGLGSALVYDGAVLTGIVTERDFLHRVIAQDRNPKTTPLGEVMTHPVVVVPATTRIGEALQLMAAGGFRRLPVEADGTLLGLVSLTHMSAWIADDDVDREIGDLITFVAGPASNRPRAGRFLELTTPRATTIDVDPDIIDIWTDGVGG